MMVNRQPKQNNHSQRTNYRPIRRSQLISPFGVGAMHTYPSGVTMMTAGLDFWYVRPNQVTPPDDREDTFWQSVENAKTQEIVSILRLRLIELSV